MKLSDVHGADAREALSLRHRLRSATQPLHTQVDRHMGRLLQHPDRGYERFLTATAAAVLPLERALDDARVADILPDWPQRARSQALLADLAELGMPAPGDPDACAALPLASEAFAFGVLYVLEGSRLGARVILSEICQASRPKRYLSHGAGQPLWQTFIRKLEDSRAAEQDHAMAIGGATAAFNLFLLQDLPHAAR